MEMRIRLPELLHEHGLTAYAVAKRSNGRIVEASLYRLVKQRGKVEYFSATLLQALADVLGVGPAELLEPDKRKR